MKQSLNPSARRLPPAAPRLRFRGWCRFGALLAAVACAWVCNGCRFDADPEPMDAAAWLDPVAAPDSAGAPAALPDADPPLDSLLDAAPPAAGAWELSVQAALVAALNNNPGFQVDRTRPAINRAAEEIQRAAFDPTLVATLQTGQSHDRADLQGVAGDMVTDSRHVTASAGLREQLPTGTALEANLGADYADSRSGAPTRTRLLSWDATVTQALLQGFGTDANYARLRQAKLDTRISEFELRGAAEALVGRVEQAYWDTVLAEHAVSIYQKSLEVAEQQVAEVAERIRVGKLADTERYAAEAEAAGSREQLIDARGAYARNRLQLLQLLRAANFTADGDRRMILADPPQAAAIALEPVAVHVAVALQQRPDLNQARLQHARGKLDLVRTRDGLLPQLDLFVRLGGSRYAQAFTATPNADGRAVDYTAGLNFAHLLGNRDAQARHQQAQWTQAQTAAALANLRNLVELDVRSAYIDVTTAQEKITATGATRALREKTLQVEEEKFRVGKSTSLLVSQAQRDLVASQIAELQALIRYRLALLDLYRLEGSLMQRRGIQVPDTVPLLPLESTPAP